MRQVTIYMHGEDEFEFEGNEADQAMYQIDRLDILRSNDVIKIFMEDVSVNWYIPVKNITAVKEEFFD